LEDVGMTPDSPLDVSYDRENDILTIEGIKYAGGLFRNFGYAFQRGELFTVLERKDGVLSVRRVLLEPEQ
jgi:hypothetical protein